MRVPRVVPVELDGVVVDPADPAEPAEPVVVLSTEHPAVELQAPDDAFQPL